MNQIDPINQGPDNTRSIKSRSSAFASHLIRNFVSILVIFFLSFSTQLSSERMPTHISGALCHPRWKDAMIHEMQDIEKNN